MGAGAFELAALWLDVAALGGVVVFDLSGGFRQGADMGACRSLGVDGGAGAGSIPMAGRGDVR